MFEFQDLNLFTFLEFSIRLELNFELIPFTYDRGHVKGFFPCSFFEVQTLEIFVNSGYYPDLTVIAS